MADAAEATTAPDTGADNAMRSTGPSASPASARDNGDDLPQGVRSAVPQSTAIQKTPALCTAAVKWKSKLPSAHQSEVPPSDGGQPAGLSADEKAMALNTPDITKEGVRDEVSPLVGPGPASPGHQPNGSAALHGEADKMVRPSIAITEVPQLGRPSSRLSVRASASSLSILATESGKLLQAVPLATGGPSGQQQDAFSGSLRINNHSLVAAIPYMPVGLAYVCLLLNLVVPGLGTLISGFSIFCCKGEPQELTKKDELISSFCTNVCVAVSQLFTIPFLLVGWIWSITWGIFMVLLALEYRRYKRNEKKITKLKNVTKAFMGR